MAFRRVQKVMFKHCDPAGIVFYPRYFEMINDTVELMFDEMLEHPFAQMHRDGRGGVPTAAIEAQFHAPSRHGDQLDITVQGTKLGRTSLGLAFAATCADAPRFSAHSTIVNIDQNGKPLAWDAEIRARIETFMKD